MADGTAKPTCFISYANEDAALATSIADAFRSAGGCEVFTYDDISPGESWRKEIEEKIGDADLFVILVSPAALSSKAVRDEWASIQERAWESQDVGILPVLVGNVHAPAFLEPWKRVHVAGKKPANVAHALTDYIQGLRSLNSQELHRKSSELSTKRANRFRDLMRSVSEDDWTT
jgi:hypothetical protein